MLTRALSTETSELLKKGLGSETEGDILFDDGARGRYATDASIYQIMPVGVFVPRTQRDVAVAIDIARDLKVPVLPRASSASTTSGSCSGGTKRVPES